MYFVLTSGISAKISNIHSWVVMCVKFIPIAIACIIGYIYLGTDHPFPNHNESNSDPFVNLFPLFGVMLSVPAIFFAFDGFYASTGIQSSLKEPKKISTILTLGLFIVSIIYVLIAISLFVFSSDGTLSTSNGFLPS
jgi:amino acid transporter